MLHRAICEMLINGVFLDQDTDLRSLTNIACLHLILHHGKTYKVRHREWGEKTTTNQRQKVQREAFWYFEVKYGSWIFVVKLRMKCFQFISHRSTPTIKLSSTHRRKRMNSIRAWNREIWPPMWLKSLVWYFMNIFDLMQEIFCISDIGWCEFG